MEKYVLKHLKKVRFSLFICKKKCNFAFANQKHKTYKLTNYIIYKLFTMKTQEIMQQLAAKHPGEAEYLQAVE